jgi:hypothetical protein
MIKGNELELLAERGLEAWRAADEGSATPGTRPRDSQILDRAATRGRHIGITCGCVVFLPLALLVEFAALSLL